MLTDKAILGLRRWMCSNCKITLGYVRNNILALRESRGKVEIDIYNATSIKRKCSVCHTENEINPSKQI